MCYSVYARRTPRARWELQATMHDASYAATVADSLRDTATRHGLPQCETRVITGYAYDAFPQTITAREMEAQHHA